MAFYNYIILDGKYYATSAKKWQPMEQKPMTARQLVDGSLDVTYGVQSLKMWEGEIVARVTETRPGYGSSCDIEASLRKLQAVAFTDHFGAAYTVHCQVWRPRSFSTNWGADSNKMFYEVRLAADA